jgi:hypothetical protein
MNEIIIKIETVNAAFEGAEGYEVARILRDLADKIEDNNQPSKVRDINGNTVGAIEYK